MVSLVMEHKPQQRQEGEEREEVDLESSFVSFSADEKSSLSKEDATCKNEKSDHAEESEHAEDNDNNGVCDDDDQATPTGYAGDDEFDDRQSSSTISGTESNFGFNGSPITNCTNNLRAREEEHQRHLYYTRTSALEKQRPQLYETTKSKKRRREEEGPCILANGPQLREKQTGSPWAPTTAAAAATTLPPIVWGKRDPPTSIYISSARCLMKYFWNQQHQEERIVKDLTASTTSSSSATSSLVAGAEAPTGDHQHKDSPSDAHNATVDQQLQRQQAPTQDSAAADGTPTPRALCAPPGLIWIPPDQVYDKEEEECSSLEASVKRRKRILRRQGLSILSPRYLSLEDTLAFSPLPRVLIEAASPHRVVHANAAYCRTHQGRSTDRFSVPDAGSSQDLELEARASLFDEEEDLSLTMYPVCGTDHEPRPFVTHYLIESRQNRNPQRAVPTQTVG